MDYNKLSSAGGKATAIKLRKKSLEIYYENPNVCLFCNNVILVEDNIKISQVRKRKFCNSFCNKEYNKKNKKIVKKFNKISKLCDNLTLEEFDFKRKNRRNVRSSICKDARNKFNSSNKDKKCFICGYDKYIEVAHINPVFKFPKDTKISVINSLENLIPLCPNHHKEYDNGLINLEKDF